VGKYVKEWETLKQTFQKNTGQKRPQDKVNLGLVVIQKSSGITPALQAIDTAIEKKERLTLEKALNSYHTVQESYLKVVQAEMKTEQDIDVQQEYTKFMRALLEIERKAGEDATKVQEAKGGVATGIKFLFLEADVKGTIEHAKKDFDAFSKFESKFKLIEKAAPAKAAAKTYTEAAAHTKYQDAINALNDFKTKAKACATACSKVLTDAEVKKNAAYVQKVQSFEKAMNDLSASARIAAQIKELNTALGH
jgi:hypothetical protein